MNILEIVLFHEKYPVSRRLLKLITNYIIFDQKNFFMKTFSILLPLVFSAKLFCTQDWAYFPIHHADEIIVMQQGEIVERGRHDMLLQKAGIYKKLYDLQSFI